jgi:hypothetical protein
MHSRIGPKYSHFRQGGLRNRRDHTNRPRRAARVVRKPENFGDSWSDPLTAGDKTKIRRYFTAREALRDFFGFIEVSSGRVERHG